MTRRFRYLGITLLAVLGLITSGCAVFATESLPKDDPGEPQIKWLLVDDFSSSDLKGSGWHIEFVEGTKGAIEVVSAPELESGNALRIAGHPETKAVRAYKYFDEEDLSNIQTISIEYRFKPVLGETSHVNIIGQGGILLNAMVQPDRGRYLYRNSSTTKVVSDTLLDGWNIVRIVADRVNNEVSIYLNDEEVPSLSGDDFRVQPVSWNGARFYVQHAVPSNAEDYPAEVLFGDIKIWTTD